MNHREGTALFRNPLFIALAAAGLFFYVARKTGALDEIVRFVTGRPYLDDAVAEKLPLVQERETIRDIEGNYDLDGVSYDDEGVIVGSDNNKTLVAPI